LCFHVTTTASMVCRFNEILFVNITVEVFFNTAV
jgi:hypothetical protein